MRFFLICPLFLLTILRSAGQTLLHSAPETRDFDRSRFARRQLVSIGGRPVQVSSPEDTILAKLRWCKMSGHSEKQFQDAVHVGEVQAKRLDLMYLEDWAKRLDVDELWKSLKKSAKLGEH